MPEKIDEGASAVREAVRAAVMSGRRRKRRKPINEDKTENAAGVTLDGIGPARETG